MNLEVIASPDGDILWASGALPDSVHDKKAEWIWGVLAELEAAGLVTLVDKGYQGSSYVKIPYRGRNKPESQKAERGQPRPRETPGTRRARERAAQDLAYPPQAPLLPLAGRPVRQGHPRIADPRGLTRMERFTAQALPIQALERIAAAIPGRFLGLAAAAATVFSGWRALAATTPGL